MKWLGLIVVIVFSCGRGLNNLTEPSNCKELAQIVNAGWKRLKIKTLNFIIPVEKGSQENLAMQ